MVSIDYRLGLKQVVASGTSPENMMLGMARTISMAVEDLYDATAFIVDKADEWGIDPRRSWPAGRVRERSPCCMANTPSATLRRWCNTCLSASATRVSFLSPGRSSKWARELRWASQPAPMMLFHGDADANVPYNVIRESGVGFFRLEVHRRTPPRDELPVLFFYSVENASHVIATAPMDGNRDAIDAFLLETRRG